MDGIIFDFDGVVVNSEPIHYECFRQVLAENGITLLKEDYYNKYLGYDDHDCFKEVFRDNGKTADEAMIARLTARKTARVQQAFSSSIKALPGSVEIMRQLRQADIPLAICSGALRSEIELAAKSVGAFENVMTIVSAEDVRFGKPHPQGYQMAHQQLCRITGRPLLPGKMVVIEDSPAGIAAGKDFGAKVLALTTSYEKSALSQADKIVANLAEVTVRDLQAMV